MSQIFTRVVIQWTPACCNTQRNDEAGTLAKRGEELSLADTSFDEAEMKAKYQNKWKKEHPRHQKNDAYCQLRREEQVKIFRFITGHNRVKIAITNGCTCGNDKMTAQHLLKECLSFEEPRQLLVVTCTSPGQAVRWSWQPKINSSILQRHTS